MDAFGAVYTDVSSIHQNSLRFWQHGYKSRNNKPTLGCVNKHQKGCQVDKNGHRTGSSPPCCLDYKTRFCCKQTSSLPLRKECWYLKCGKEARCCENSREWRWKMETGHFVFFRRILNSGTYRTVQHSSPHLSSPFPFVVTNRCPRQDEETWLPGWCTYDVKCTRC